MRQVGKSTLIRSIAKTYLSLDDDFIILPLERGEWGTVEGAATPVAIDECQKLPGLFDRIKLLVDNRKKPGQFILTGSVRFLSKKQIKESLTGRTTLLELLPFTLSESHEKPLFDFIQVISEKSINERILKGLDLRAWASKKTIAAHLNVGGLPGVCFKRDEKVRARILDIHIETLLSRDIQHLYATRLPSVRLRGILSEICEKQGMPINESLIARKVGVSAPTVRSVLTAFEGLFLIRRVGKLFYVEDSALADSLLEYSGLSEFQRWSAFFFRELYALLSYRYTSLFSLESYETRGGAYVPFIVKRKNLSPIAFTVDADSGVSDKSLKSMASLRRHRSDLVCICLHTGSQSYFSSSGIPCISIMSLV